MAPLRDKLTVGSRVIIAEQADLRGEISIGSGTVIHPKATILALQGPISIGSNCIIEETAAIVNRTKELMKIGDENLFEVGCRIESPRIGSYNTFEIRSRVAHTVSIGSFCTVGAACTLIPSVLWPDDLKGIFEDDQEDVDHLRDELQQQEVGRLDSTTSSQSQPSAIGDDERVESIPDRTVVFGIQAKRRLWSGEGLKQQAALHAKHLEYLREAIPRSHKLKIIQ
ncbi:trimeric LpxA-like protein [Violaceomyces palustris]|uniref:Trimeric LpxA-like protein n=1 Tax=Violaceomyces palustris TaxID=1673888 RepID=A0ACD0NZR7_9BASI|nr:trimeric LpxA-like protein [Violaceomyces palustris]